MAKRLSFVDDEISRDYLPGRIGYVGENAIYLARVWIVYAGNWRRLVCRI